VIFRPDVARLIVRGGKTATRVPVRPGGGRAPFRIGHSYAVQPGPRRAALARVVVLEAEHEPLGDVGFDHARAEGHRTTDDFKVAWVPWARAAAQARPRACAPTRHRRTQRRPRDRAAHRLDRAQSHPPGRRVTHAGKAVAW
jgi:hypothetical protein